MLLIVNVLRRGGVLSLAASLYASDIKCKVLQPGRGRHEET
jgi:hypothetical protein